MVRSLRAVAAWSPLGAFVVLTAVVAGLATTGVFADNIDQTDVGARYAWGENVGWLKARPTAEAYGAGGNGLQVTDTEVLGYLWGENIGWVNFSCQNDATCGGAAGNWGVKNDGAGNLSGYAWSENAGWINFSCATNATCGSVSYGVTISMPGTYDELADWGHFGGKAWGENIGWINFGDGVGLPASVAIQTGWPDSDGDGCRDSKEPLFTLDPWNKWDFYSVPLPNLLIAADPTLSVRPHTLTASNAQAVFSYFKKTAKTGSLEYEQDLNLNGVKDGIEYDRSFVSLGHSGPPDGFIVASDAQLAFAEFKLGYFC